LTTLLQAELGPDAYPGATDAAELRRMFEEDIRRLRQWGVEIPDARKTKVYTLASYGEFSPVALDEIALDALAFLLETFGPGAPNSERVQQLLRSVTDWLPSHQAASLTARRQRLRLDLRQRDDAVIDPTIEQTIDRSLREGRLLRFAYRSPGRTDDVTPVHTVDPWYKVFDTIRGHFYLDAYWLESTSPHGRYKQQKWQKFRLDFMLAGQIELLPTKRNPAPPPRPRHQLEYLLSPRIARYGRVTRHFEQMKVHESDVQGWVRVTATTPDLFQAVRLLLTYGPNCKVIGGPEARREMEKLVRGLGEVYGVTLSGKGNGSEH
jgi:predicted DNA-binding transcriptional regulator YafY